MLIGTAVCPNANESWVAAWTRLNALFGPFQTGRIYSANVCPGPDDERVKAVVASGALPLISFKTWDATSQRNFARLVAGLDRFTITFNHEPEDNAISTADIASCYAAMRVVVNAAHKPGIKLWHVLMGWTLNPKSGRDVEKFLTPGLIAALDGLGWDCYSYLTGAHQAVDLFGAGALYSKSKGLPWAVFETGSEIGSGTTDDTTAAWYTQAIAFARNPRGGGVDADPAELFTLWNSVTGGHEYRIDALAKTAAVWKAACRYAPPTPVVTPPVDEAVALGARIVALQAQLATAVSALATGQADLVSAQGDVSQLQQELETRTATLVQIASLAAPATG